MANICNISTNYSTIDGYIDAWESDVNVTNNTSVVHAKVYLHRNNTWSGNTYSSSVWRRLSIDGVDVANYTAAMTVPPQSSGYVCVAEGSRTITHNSDGSKSVTIGYQATDNVSGSYLGSSWQTGTLGLTTIPRCSTGTFSKTNYTIGDQITINFNRASSSFTHSGYIQFPDQTGWIWAGEKYFSGAGTSWSWTPTSSEIDALYARIPNSTSANMWADCKTMSGSTEIGQFSVGEAYMSVNPDICRPLFSDFTYRDTNTTTTAITGNDQILIQGLSTLQVDITAANQMTPRKSATFKQYAAQISGLSKSLTSLTGSITGFGTSFIPGEQTLSVTATDSRGLTASAQKTVKVLAYSEPVIDASAIRKNNFENETTLHISGKISPLNDGTSNLNQISSIKYRYKAQSTSTWGSWYSKSGWTLNDDGSYTISDNVIDLDNSQSYDLQVQITDQLSTITVDLAVSVGIPIFRIGTDGLVYNNEQPLMPSHIGQIIMTTTLNTAAKVQAIYGGTWVAWGGGRVPVGIGSNGTTNYSSAEATGGEERHTLSVSEIPSHSHMIRSGWSDTSPGSDAYRYQFWGANNLGWHGGDYGTSSTGGSGSHENRQPYITVYMWKRTA